MSSISATASISEIAKTLANGGPAIWAAQTEEGLSALKARCDTHWTSTTPFLHSGKLLAMAAALMTLSVMGLLGPSKGGLVFEWLGVASLGKTLVSFFVGMLVSTMILTFFAMSVSAMFKLNLAQTLSGELELMREHPFLCCAALDLVKESDDARAYRDQVLSQGRQLRVGDFACLVFSMQEGRRRKRPAMCQELHGITGAASQAS
jgi:hypothetical protein